MGLDSDSEQILINDEEMKTPASMAYSRSKECYCCELRTRGYICIGVTMLTLIEESQDIQSSVQVVTWYFLCRFYVLHIAFLMQAHPVHIVSILLLF